MTGSPLLALDRVAKSFGGAKVLDNITLGVARGEFVSFIGPSGCGKSTLLRLIAGLTPATEGSILVDGIAPAEARGEMAFVFQDAALLPWRRVSANVALPLELRREVPAAIESRVAAMLELVGLSHAAQKYPWQLSGGMKMRVSIARALSISPRVLLLDEPFGALDEMTRDRLNEDLLAIRQTRPFTGFFVTHSVAEAVFLSTRIVVLSPGPGRIATMVPVPFPYPRTSELRQDPEFLGLLAETSRALWAVESHAHAR